jgi:ribosome-associated translation inhibitor RaiA
MAASISAKEGRVHVKVTNEGMEITLDGVPLGRIFSPSAVTDLMVAMDKVSDKIKAQISGKK